MGLVVVFLLLLFVVGVENTIPAFVRTEFDAVGSYYLKKLQSSGGITQTDKNEINSRLNELGFQNIRIVAPERVAWGEEAHLKIVADYQIKQTKPDLRKNTKVLSATFDEKTIVMTLDK